jgi:hypothetical protein
MVTTPASSARRRESIEGPIDVAVVECFEAIVAPVTPVTRS